MSVHIAACTKQKKDWVDLNFLKVQYMRFLVPPLSNLNQICMYAADDRAVERGMKCLDSVRKVISLRMKLSG